MHIFKKIPSIGIIFLIIISCVFSKVITPNDHSKSKVKIVKHNNPYWEDSGNPYWEDSGNPYWVDTHGDSNKTSEPIAVQVANTSSTGSSSTGTIEKEKETKDKNQKSCYYKGRLGTCIDEGECDTTLNDIKSKRCPGLGDNIKCCIPKNRCVDYDGNNNTIIGTCKSKSDCKNGYFNSNRSGVCSGTNICCFNKDPKNEVSTDDILENLKKNLNSDLTSEKKKAMIITAKEMLKYSEVNYNPKFVAGMLGNIQNEGTMGEFEEIPKKKTNLCYRKCINKYFPEYNENYSKKSITNIGIKKARELSEAVYKVKCELDEDCKNKDKREDNTYIAKFGLGIIQWTDYNPGDDIRKDGLLNAYEKFKSKNKNKDKPTKNECIEVESNYLVKEFNTIDSYFKVYDNWLVLEENQTPYEAGRLLCKNYIGNTDEQADLRGNNAKTIYKAMFD